MIVNRYFHSHFQISRVTFYSLLPPEGMKRSNIMVMTNIRLNKEVQLQVLLGDSGNPGTRVTLLAKYPNTKTDSHLCWKNRSTLFMAFASVCNSHVMLLLNFDNF